MEFQELLEKYSTQNLFEALLKAAYDLYNNLENKEEIEWIEFGEDFKIKPAYLEKLINFTAETAEESVEDNAEEVEPQDNSSGDDIKQLLLDILGAINELKSQLSPKKNDKEVEDSQEAAEESLEKPLPIVYTESKRERRIYKFSLIKEDII